ncbi:SRPBCC family protein [uncultured Jatrophihabitans sp.]|uniref:SRPBCC family protein n=1 Tax=uncultured Jatrophihabitans sp. TaxID=1610747 RepID=UPI0035CC7BE4
MSAFVVTAKSPLPPQQAWDRVTDWQRHGEHVPLTRVTIETPPPAGIGTRFTARTGTAKLGFDDPMEVVSWEPPADGRPGVCRIEKRGRVMLGWAELTVEALGAGSVTTWREEVNPRHLPRFAEPVARGFGRVVFGRVVRKLLASPRP